MYKKTYEKDDVLVSVITPTYNRFDNIKCAINSVLIQNYPNIEYIICDDGSENFPYDDIVKFIEDNKKNNLKNYKIIVNKHNLGTVKNLNNAYKLASGKYIVNLADDDEFFATNVVSELVDRIKQFHCAVMVSTRLVYQQNKKKYFLPHKLNAKMLSKCSNRKLYSLFVSGFNYTMSSGSAFVIDKEKFQQSGCYDENFVLLEDMPFAEKMISNNMLGFAYDIISVKYVLGGVSTTNIMNPKLKKDLYLFDTMYKLKNADYILPFFKKYIFFTNTLVTIQSAVKRKFFWMIHPRFLLFMLFYKSRNMIALFYDIIALKLGTIGIGKK